MDLADYGIGETMSANSSLCADEEYIQYFCKNEKEDAQAKDDKTKKQKTNEEDEDELEENVEQVIKEMKIRKKKVIPADERRRIGLKPEEAKKSEN